MLASLCGRNVFSGVAPLSQMSLLRLWLMSVELQVVVQGPWRDSLDYQTDKSFIVDTDMMI